MTDQPPQDVAGSALVRDLDAYESLLSVIRRRRSIRKYDPRPVPEEDLMRVLEAGRWAPSGANIQPWAFLVVEDAERRGAVAELLIEEGRYLQKKDPRFPAYERRYHRDVPLYLIFACDDRAKRSFPQTEAFPVDMTLYMSVSAAIMNVHLAAAALGLGTVWYTVEEPTEKELKKLLGIPDSFFVPSLTPLGYPLQGRSSARRPLERMVHRERMELSNARRDDVMENLFTRKMTAMVMGGKPIDH
ncbi:MAG: nitroreductase family protein [Nitrospinota bacterium]|nr:nitroreductase family protein [Nitrospinota bacterium]MDP7386733.1 nitroreductase family protein [Nitrospinota bacterium]